MHTKKFSNAQIVIIGSGVAGLYTALSLPSNVPITILTKGKLKEGNTTYAQGGIAVALSPQDSFSSHIQDTLEAGAGLCDKNAVKFLARKGVLCIKDLIKRGMSFDKKGGKISFTREAAHSMPRIIHAGGDATGSKLQEFLIEKILQCKNIQIQENALVTSIKKTKKSQIFSLEYLAKKDKTKNTKSANFVVIASGGCGQVYQHTTNPLFSSGDGLLLAKELNLTIKDMEFYQFHPTALRPFCNPFPDRDFLISEAVRGEGGILLNQNGERFMQKYDQRLELATRDIVTRAIWEQLEQEQTNHVFLDISHFPKAKVLTRFPTIYAECLKHNLDPTKQPIPVSPTAHYQIGGIVTDLKGRTTEPNIYATGEVACTGVHGANRLASNSLLESLVFSHNAALDISKKLQKIPKYNPAEFKISCEKYEDLPAFVKNEISLLKKTIKNLMWEKAGIIRRETELKSALSEIRKLKKMNGKLGDIIHPASFEIKCLFNCAKLIIQAAIKRKKSIGAHYRLN